MWLHCTTQMDTKAAPAFRSQCAAANFQVQISWMFFTDNKTGTSEYSWTNTLVDTRKSKTTCLYAFENWGYRVGHISDLHKQVRGKHSKLRPRNFPCPLCTGCFYTLQELRAHVTTHAREKQYKCCRCHCDLLFSLTPAVHYWITGRVFTKKQQQNLNVLFLNASTARPTPSTWRSILKLTKLIQKSNVLFHATLLAALIPLINYVNLEVQHFGEAQSEPLPQLFLYWMAQSILPELRTDQAHQRGTCEGKE